MVHQDDSFIREVNEELRSDQMRLIWQRFGRILIAAAVLVVLGTIGKVSYEYWRDSEALFRQALRVDPHNWLAREKLARLLLQRGDVEEAISHLRAALDVDPNYAEARYSLAVALERQGKIQSSIAEY